jgi:hypothetical protein
MMQSAFHAAPAAAREAPESAGSAAFGLLLIAVAALLSHRSWTIVEEKETSRASRRRREPIRLHGDQHRTPRSLLVDPGQGRSDNCRIRGVSIGADRDPALGGKSTSQLNILSLFMRGIPLRYRNTGKTWVKLSGAYADTKIGPPTYADSTAAVQAYAKVAPERCVWGSGWRHPSEREKSRTTLCCWISSSCGRPTNRCAIVSWSRTLLCSTLIQKACEGFFLSGRLLTSFTLPASASGHRNDARSLLLL